MFNFQTTGIYCTILFMIIYNVRIGRPSDNIRSGIRSSAVDDSEVLEEIKTNFENANGAHGTSLIRKKTQKKLGLLPDDEDAAAAVTISAEAFLEANGHAPEFRINIESMNGQKQPMESTATLSASAAIYAKRDTSYPQFLVDSRVVGAQEILQAAQNLQQQRRAEKDGEIEQLPDAKRSRIEDETDGTGRLNINTTVIPPVSQTEDELDEDIEWED